VRLLLVSGCIVFADQLTKLLVKGISIPSLGIHIEGMPYGVSKPILGDFLRLTYIENPGMAFGIDLGGKLFFSLFSVLASFGILYYLYRSRNEPLGFKISLALILGGAVGNLIDRVFYGVLFSEAPLFYGKVVDFLDVDFLNITIGSYHMSRWPVFNIADASVSIGVVLLVIFHRTTSLSQSTCPGGSPVPQTAVADSSPGKPQSPASPIEQQ